MSRRWLLLIYTVPTTPSRTRAYVWRELRRKGALLVRDGVAALPESAAARTWASEAAKRIAAGGGNATASRATFGTPDERRLISAFQRERDREYAEIKSSCADLLAHIAREREHAAFSFEELEELEADLGKIQRWFADVRQRDWFRAPAGRAAERALASCERRVRGFAERASREDLAARAVGPLARPRAAADAPPKRNRRSRG